MSINDNDKRNPLGDSSLFFLIISNLITIGFAVLESWNLQTVLLVYWFQSVIIGIFNFIRILELKEFSVEGLMINGRPAENTKSETTKIPMTIVFCFCITDILAGEPINDKVVLHKLQMKGSFVPK